MALLLHFKLDTKPAQILSNIIEMLKGKYREEPSAELIAAAKISLAAEYVRDDKLKGFIIPIVESMDSTKNVGKNPWSE